ncbi:hypothetical protein GLW08_09875 [Pontibacillus yanchengensis]|uniref:Uncharacterized protein n=2 Tax=Pontibacillus yanchengensis TaxID=462910 RepID=A0A6I5A5N0_9BACI|nr:cell wall-active antibiotics response protein LiaF [Pontibacillus yanchengensis]MYL35583.1 hypothetical protein [Pontibacillus yanchengensis]MYL53643.1 hypothetical protein [Pontibacillus yanchengensis]
MLSRLSTSTLNWIIIIGFILLGVEIIFFNGGLIFSLLFSSLLLYVGKRKYYRTFGKVLFWVGVITIFFTVINMIAVRFLLIAGIVLFVRYYYKTKQNPDKWEAIFASSTVQENEHLCRTAPLLKQRLMGDQITSEVGYEWHDVNIHGGFGDRVLDLSNTVLPDEAVISIRHLIGNIEIYVPYEVEVSVHHSSILGRANIFGTHHLKLMNHQLSYHTPGYVTEKPKVKIVTSLFSGDIEVKRI